MALPTISISDRDIILLSGYETVCEDGTTLHVVPGTRCVLVIRDESSLRAIVHNDNEAVAYGYVAGRWVPAA